MPTLARINLYPFKSLDAQQVDQAVLLPSGGLEHDRRFMLVDRAGDPINGKRTAALHRLRSKYEPANRRLTLQVAGAEQAHPFNVDSEREELQAWLADYLDQAVTILENAAGGFPDDFESPGPTLISTATLAEVAGWFGGLAVDETRDRFRANLEIDADEPFWEDRLVDDGIRPVRFRIGEAELLGTNPCVVAPCRPAIPTRASRSISSPRRLPGIVRSRCPPGRRRHGSITFTGWP